MTLKDLEKLIEETFKKDFKDLSYNQLGKIAEVIISCDNCPISCTTGSICHEEWTKELTKLANEEKTQAN